MASVVSGGIKPKATAKCTVCTVRYSMLFRSIQEMEDYGLGRGVNFAGFIAGPVDLCRSQVLYRGGMKGKGYSTYKGTLARDL
jgi:hypothetical protein